MFFNAYTYNTTINFALTASVAHKKQPSVNFDIYVLGTVRRDVSG